MPCYQRPRNTLAIIITTCLLAGSSLTCCSAFAPSKLPRVSSSPSSSSLQAAFLPPVVDIDALQSTSAFLLADATAAVTGAAEAAVVESSNDGGLTLSSLLHIPTLWSILAMTSIVALLVAWEEAIE